ncbi:MAG TPA: PASTA domain-containing protein [Gaiellaceae bacterium]|nr:PASTA domain-containing protein [Gaiellaceae bacterium]
MQPEPPAPPRPRGGPPPGPPPPVPPEPLPPERELWPWLLALAIVVVGAIVAWIVVAKVHHHQKRTVTVVATRVVPSVVSLPRAVALRRLAAAGFHVQVRFASSTKPKGMVVAQAPEGGARLSQGGSVALTVSGGKPKLAAPDVVGMAIAVAVKRLQAAGLKSRQRVIFASAPPGRVVSQRPDAGTAVKKGATVALSVSRGPQRVAVPNVVGRRRDDAIARIKQAGLVAGVFSVPSREPRGFVVAQSPQSGTKAPKHSRVRLNVSQGAPAATTTATAPAPTTTAAGGAATAKVPNVVGRSQAAAQRRLRAAGFRVRTVYVASTQPQGTVVAQHPAPGTSLRRDSRVRINVSNGPNPKPATAVPDVSGEDEATARADLQAAGFRVSVVDQPTADENEDGIVLDQDPAGGTRAPAGSVVTIFVGRFSG